MLFMVISAVLTVQDLVTREFQRMGMRDKTEGNRSAGVKENKGWHISGCNSKYE